MISKVICLAALCAFVFACRAQAADSYHKPIYKPPPKPYSFSYGIKDPYNGADFGQQEESDGNKVLGSYSVQLPDGRKQTVTYEADHDRGFIAHVSYDGKAQYPSKVGPPFIVQPYQGGGGGGGGGYH